MRDILVVRKAWHRPAGLLAALVEMATLIRRNGERGTETSSGRVRGRSILSPPCRSMALRCPPVYSPRGTLKTVTVPVPVNTGSLIG